MKIIVSTHYNRPNCTQQMIDWVSKCIGVETYHFIFFIEPGCPEVADIIENCTLNKTIHYNDRLLGCWTNKKQAVEIGFESCDYLIFLEDDCLLAKDALLYFEYCNKTYRYMKSIGTVTAYNRFSSHDYIQGQFLPNQLSERRWYNSTTWAIWKHKYEMIDNWTGQDKDLKTKLHDYYGMYEVFPILSRANNIGHVNGKTTVASEMLRLVGDKAYAPIGLSRNGGFVSGKTEYINKIKDKLYINVIENYNHEESTILKNQYDKCLQYEFENQLVTNELGEEFVKLDENNFKSRNNKLYKENYYLDFWAGNYDFEFNKFNYIFTKEYK